MVAARRANHVEPQKPWDVGSLGAVDVVGRNAYGFIIEWLVASYLHTSVSTSCARPTQLASFAGISAADGAPESVMV